MVVNEVKEILVGVDGLFFILVVLYLIRKLGSDGGIVLFVSYNLGGLGKDFGIKFNNVSGSFVLEFLIDLIFENIKIIDYYLCFFLLEL